MQMLSQCIRNVPISFSLDSQLGVAGFHSEIHRMFGNSSHLLWILHLFCSVYLLAWLRSNTCGYELIQHTLLFEQKGKLSKTHVGAEEPHKWTPSAVWQPWACEVTDRLSAIRHLSSHGRQSMTDKFVTVGLFSLKFKSTLPGPRSSDSDTVD